MSDWSGSNEDTPPGCKLPPSHCILTWQRVERSKHPHSLCKSTNLICGDSTLMTSFNPNCLPRVPPTSSHHIVGGCCFNISIGGEDNPHQLKGTCIQSITAHLRNSLFKVENKVKQIESPLSIVLPG